MRGAPLLASVRAEAALFILSTSALRWPPVSALRVQGGVAKLSAAQRDELDGRRRKRPQNGHRPLASRPERPAFDERRSSKAGAVDGPYSEMTTARSLPRTLSPPAGKRGVVPQILVFCGHADSRGNSLANRLPKNAAQTRRFASAQAFCQLPNPIRHCSAALRSRRRQSEQQLRSCSPPPRLKHVRPHHLHRRAPRPRRGTL